MATDAEIGVLEALAAQGERVESKTGSCTPPFCARLRLVDRARRMLLLDRSSDEAANRALLALPRAEFQFEWDKWRIDFVAYNPAAFSHEATETIRLDLPVSVEIGRRRIHPRTPDPRPPLRCVAYVGGAVVFDAAVTDVSQGGIGLEFNFAGDELEPGMVLTGCRLECQDSEAVIVDLEVRYTTTTALLHGSRIARVGCRYVKLPEAAMALIANYTDARENR